MTVLQGGFVLEESVGQIGNGCEDHVHAAAGHLEPPLVSRKAQQGTHVPRQVYRLIPVDRVEVDPPIHARPRDRPHDPVNRVAGGEDVSHRAERIFLVTLLAFHDGPAFPVSVARAVRACPLRERARAGIGGDGALQVALERG